MKLRQLPTTILIEVYDDCAYEVEFSDDEGITVAQIVVHGEDLEICEV